MSGCTRCGGSGYRLWSRRGRDGYEDLLEDWCDKCPAGAAGKAEEAAAELAEFEANGCPDCRGTGVVDSSAYWCGCPAGVAERAKDVRDIVDDHDREVLQPERERRAAEWAELSDEEKAAEEDDIDYVADQLSRW